MSQTILGALDPDAAAPILSRRDAIRRGAGASGATLAGLAMGSVPVALAAFARDLHATRVAPNLVAVLNFALALEQLELAFYTGGLAVPGLLAGIDRTVFDQIARHEAAHVQFLTQTITALGGTPATPPTYDFTGGGGTVPGPFTTVFSDVAVFRALAQALEDTGVRAYKGQAPALRSNPDLLTAALRIHSVEARHAARVRLLRGDTPTVHGVTIPGTDAVYAGEELLTQAGIGLTQPNATAAQRAFDEPLGREQVAAIANLFIGTPKLG